jgi:membrane-associated protease RseP (regulator of RpoE activity)
MIDRRFRFSPPRPAPVPAVSVLAFGFAFAFAVAVSIPVGAAASTETPGQPGSPPSRPQTRTFVWKGMTGGYLGVQVLDLTPELRRHFGVAEDEGVLIASVEEKGPAAVAGVLVGDVLTRVDGSPVSDSMGLARAVRRKKAGDNVPLELYRDGSSVQVMVSIEERERPVIDFAGIRALPRMEGPSEFEAPIEGGPDHPGQGFVFVGPGLDEESVKAFEEAMRGIENRFDSKEWQDKLEKFREMDLSKIQERMKEVEERLKKLEKELQEEGQDKDKKKLDL